MTRGCLKINISFDFDMIFKNIIAIWKFALRTFILTKI